MILKEVVVSDFRSFAGTHRFDLEPKDGPQRPIVLFGGLNGAGKTTLLTAVRLGLYGKQSLGPAVSVREYSDYLTGAIHKNPHAVVQPRHAKIELLFSYARQGVLEEFRVIRSWRHTGKSVSEKLAIVRNGDPLDELSQEQAQGFLNELIPIGVSDLFFFDGEKIAELAEDDTGQSLKYAVKKLLGLDIIERLHDDLAVVLRREKTRNLPGKLQAEIRELEQRMEQVLAEKERATEAYYQITEEELGWVRTEAGELERQLTGETSRGISRRTEQERQAQLVASEQQLTRALLEELGHAYPLAHAQRALAELLSDLENTAERRRQHHLAEFLQSRLSTLDARLSGVVGESNADAARSAVREALADLLEPGPAPAPHLDVSDSQLARYQQWVRHEVPTSAERVTALQEELRQVQSALEQSSLSLAEAVDDEELHRATARLRELDHQKGELEKAAETQLGTIKRLIREALEINRRIEELHRRLTTTHAEASALTHAERSRNLLQDFAQETARRRVRELEARFLEAYRKLARKQDVAIAAAIDPNSFEIILRDGKGNALAKKDLSAGEKQIYAIAILEALAKTSGRRLPLIIDTPLGRLDSQHRERIVTDYLPQASHQVIVLSTDTEIDESFYGTLEEHISHAFELRFNERTHSSEASEGYFWQTPRAAKAV